MNDYIIEAVHSREQRCFPFFLHHYENRLMVAFAVSCCGRGWIAMTRNAFWTTKWAVCLPCWIVCANTIPYKEQFFDLCAYHFIGNAFLTCRIQEGAGSFENVDE